MASYCSCRLCRSSALLSVRILLASRHPRVTSRPNAMSSVAPVQKPGPHSHSIYCNRRNRLAPWTVVQNRHAASCTPPPAPSGATRFRTPTIPIQIRKISYKSAFLSNLHISTATTCNATWNAYFKPRFTTTRSSSCSKITTDPPHTVTKPKRWRQDR